MRTKTLDELIEEQEIEPLTVQELAVVCAQWPKDHDPDELLAWILRTCQERRHPNIIGGKWMLWAAAIVVGSILLAGLAILLMASFPSARSSAGLLVGGLVFFN